MSDNEWGVNVELYMHQKKSILRMENLEKQEKLIIKICM